VGFDLSCKAQKIVSSCSPRRTSSMLGGGQYVGTENAPMALPPLANGYPRGQRGQAPKKPSGGGLLCHTDCGGCTVAMSHRDSSCALIWIVALYLNYVAGRAPVPHSTGELQMLTQTADRRCGWCHEAPVDTTMVTVRMLPTPQVASEGVGHNTSVVTVAPPKRSSCLLSSSPSRPRRNNDPVLVVSGSSCNLHTPLAGLAPQRLTQTCGGCACCIRCRTSGAASSRRACDSQYA